MAKTATALTPQDIATICDAIEKQDEVALLAARRSENPQIREKLHLLIRQQLAELLDSAKKSETIKNRVAKRMTSLVRALRGKQDPDTELLLLDLFAQRAKIAKIQGKEPKHDVNWEVMQTMASSTEKASSAMLAELDSYSPEQFTSALIFAMRYCSREKVYDYFHDWLVPAADAPKRKNAKAKAETVAEELEIFRSGVLYAKGYNPEMIDDDDPNHADRVPMEKRLDPRWLEVAVAVDNFDLIEGLTRAGDVATQNWSERRLAENFASKKAPKIRSSKLVKLLQLSEHPRALQLYEDALRRFLARNDLWEAAILLENIPLFPKSAAQTVAGIDVDLPEPLRPLWDESLAKLKNRT